MYLTAQDRLALITSVKKGEKTVSQACREAGISRKTFYKWYKRYNQAPPDKKLESLKDRQWKLIRHGRKTPTKVEKLVLDIVHKHPRISYQGIRKKLQETLGDKVPSKHAIQNILTRYRLRDSEAKKSYRENRDKNGLAPQDRYLAFEATLNERKPVSQVCRELGISRKTYYKWLKRYFKAREFSLEAFNDREWKIEDHPRKISGSVENRILSYVAENPVLSSKKLAVMVGIGNHGTQNVLLRLGLNTYDKRLAYAQENGYEIKDARPEVYWQDRLKQVFQEFLPSRAPAPPPVLFGTGLQRLRRFAPYFLFLLLVTFGLYEWGQLLGSATSTSQAIGWISASLALSMGSVFFLYSLKYYFSLAVVLSFSREEGDKQESMKSYAKVFWFLRLFGIGKRVDSKLSFEGKKAQLLSSSPGGLEPDLTKVELERKPFISVHIPLYNESRVAERVLKACTSLDYDRYEVVVVDDSTDETTSIVRQFAEQWNTGLKRSDLNSGMARSDLHRPLIKVIHRDNREGFKGGALREALRVSDPQAEFVVVFDADFVPYPDNLELFLKYFQVNSGSLDPKTYSQKPIAAVQGYQWHVLNKSENWITRGVRSEYAGSYVIERSGEELYGGIKQIAGSVYMIRRDLLEHFNWGTSLTEDFELTLRLYEQGYKVVYTPYIQAPAECASTLRRLVRQRMRWAEGHSFNIKKHFVSMILKPKLTLPEKLEFLYLSPYYLQAAFFLLGTISWLVSDAILRNTLPFWTSIWGWSLVLTNLLSLPLMNAVGLFLEEAEERDFVGVFSFVLLSYILVPFQAYASVKGFLEKEEGPWFRTPKTGLITDVLTRGRFYRFVRGIFPGRLRPLVAERFATIGLTRIIPVRMPAYAFGQRSSILFGAFRIPSKRRRRMRNGMLAGLLIAAILLNYLSFFTPQSVQAQASDPTIEQQINIIDQEYSTTSTTAFPTDNSLGLILWNGEKYNDETVYFEAVIRCDTCTGGNTEVDATLYTDAGSPVTGGTVSTTSSTYTRVRSSAITANLTDDEEYTVRIALDATSGTAYIKAARLIIVQSVSSGSSIAETLTQIEIGNAETLDVGGEGVTVQTGTCSIAGGSSSTTCSISPALSDTTKTFMVFQATDSGATPNSSNTRCVLTNTTTITCERNSTLGTINIRWHTAEISSGVSVQHLAPACTGTTTNVTISEVDMSKTFLLYSQERDGSNQSRDDYRMVELTSSTNVQITFQDVSCGAVQQSLQVVEFDEASVTRGTITNFTGLSQQVSGLSSVDTSKTFLLYSWRKSDNERGEMCEAMLRGEVDSATSITIHRGDSSVACDDTTIEGISWERVEFTNSTTVQQKEVSMAAATSTANVSITSVDTSQTIVFAGGQFTSGQAAGEGDYSGNDIVGEMLGRHNLTSQTNLQVIRDSTNGSARWSSFVVEFIDIGFKDLTDKKLYYFDASKFSSVQNIYFEATLLGGQGAGDAVARARLQCGSSRLGEVSSSSSSWTRVRSAGISIPTGSECHVEGRSDNGGANKIASAKIIVDQGFWGGITDMELVHQYNNTLATDTDSTYTSQDFDNEFNKANFAAGTFVAFFETTIKTSNGSNAYFARLDTPLGEQTATDTTYTRKTSADLWSSLPGSATDIDVQLKNAAASGTTTSSSTSWLIIQVSNLQVPEHLLFAVPFIVFMPYVMKWWRRRRLALRHCHNNSCIIVHRKAM